MTDEPYADDHAGSAHPDPEMRAALATLLADEPPAPPVQDDVARGRVLLHRRRTRAGAAVGLAAVLVAVVGAGAMLRPTSPVATSVQPSSPATEMADRLAPALSSMGWTVTGSELVTTAQRTEIRLSLVSTDESGDKGQLWVLGSDPAERLTSPYLASCTQETCPGTRQMTIADGVTATSGFEERGAFSGSLEPPGAGAVMLDREYGTGSLVEVVSVPGVDVGPTWTPRPGPSPETAQPPGVLSYDQLSRLLTAVGDPLRASPRPAPSVDAPACRDSDVKLTPAPVAVADLGRQALAIEVDARNPDVRCTITGSPQLRVIGSDGAVLPIAYNQAELATRPVMITQGTSPAARAVLRWSVCRSTPGSPVTSLRVTLPGDSIAVTVEVPEGLGPTTCAGLPAITLDVGPFAAAGETPPVPVPTSPEPWPSTSEPTMPEPTPPPTSTALPRVLSGLRGVAATTSACPALPDVDVPADVPITGEVTRLWVCATSVIEPIPARRRPPVEVSPSNGRLFAPLLRELARADGRPDEAGTYCRAYFEGPTTLVLETTTGFWLAHLPRDECQHFSPDLRNALDRATG